MAIRPFPPPHPALAGLVITTALTSHGEVQVSLCLRLLLEEKNSNFALDLHVTLQNSCESWLIQNTMSFAGGLMFLKIVTGKYKT